jgi:hypothetical protein
MKAVDLIPVLKTSIVNNFNILLTGSPGSGKSQIVEQVCKELNYDYVIDLSCTSDPTFYKGLPSNVNGEAKFLPYSLLKKMQDAKRELVVFFDDLGWSSTSIQQAVASIILAREINGHKISDFVRFVACTNRKTDNAGVGNFISPLISRFNTIVNLEPDADSWKKWALQPKNNIPIELISFINFKPERINTFTGAKGLENFSSPRTLANLAKWVNSGILDFEVISGCVGTTCATEFLAFYKIYRSLGTLPEKIILNPTGAEIPKEQSIIYALVGALSHKSTEANFDAITTYMSRLSTEFQVFYFKDSITKNPKLAETNAFINWSVNNPSVIR